MAWKNRYKERIEAGQITINQINEAALCDLFKLNDRQTNLLILDDIITWLKKPWDNKNPYYEQIVRFLETFFND